MNFKIVINQQDNFVFESGTQLADKGTNNDKKLSIAGGTPCPSLSSLVTSSGPFAPLAR
jgi:hypothetical protein